VGKAGPGLGKHHWTGRPRTAERQLASKRRVGKPHTCARNTNRADEWNAGQLPVGARIRTPKHNAERAVHPHANLQGTGKHIAAREFQTAWAGKICAGSDKPTPASDLHPTGPRFLLRASERRRQEEHESKVDRA
jgi:hypothetical protein